MTRRVLMIGKNTNIAFEILGYMQMDESIDVTFCSDEVEIAIDAIGKNEPELTLICLAEFEEEHKILFMEMMRRFPDLNVVCFGTAMEQFKFKQFLEMPYFKVLISPFRSCDIVSRMEPFFPGIKTNKIRSDKTTVLLVDDSALLLRSLRGDLMKMYDVYVAISGREALKIFDEREIDIVILDYEMPEMNGKDVFEEMKSREDLKDIPVIFLTGETDKNKIMEVALLGPAGYMLKPINTEKICNQINSILGI